MADNRQNPQQQKQQSPPAQEIIDNMALSPLEKKVQAAGFEPLFRNAHNEMVWQDPEGEGSKRVDPLGVKIVLPQKASDTGETEKVIHQGLCQPVSWKYTTSAALRVIKQRELEGGGEGTPLMRLAKLGAKIDALYEIHNDLILALKPLLKRPIPEKRENLVTEIGAVRNHLATALMKSENEWAALQAPPAVVSEPVELKRGEPAA